MDAFSVTHTLDLAFSGILYLGVFFPGLLIHPLFSISQKVHGLRCAMTSWGTQGRSLPPLMRGRELWPLSAGLGTHETLGMLSALKTHTSLPERLLGLLNIRRAGSFHWLTFTISSHPENTRVCVHF